MGSEAICHNKVIEELALPGQLVLGTDSHTCMAGALGCFAFGVGSTDMAAAWATKDVRVTVPETAKFVLRGALRPGVCAKDVMLHVLSQPFFKTGQGIGKVLEFAGDGVRGLSLDERATLTNMAVEAGGFTGIVEADEVVVDYLVKQRGLDADAVRARLVRADEGATYLATFEVDLAAIEPMVATPGDPRNGVPLARLGAPVKIDIAYGGSCTGGKKADMDMYAEVLAAALAQGKRVADGVHLYIQFGSQDIRRYAEAKGYLDVFRRAGTEARRPILRRVHQGRARRQRPPRPGDGERDQPEFPGRSGPGQVYLASPAWWPRAPSRAPSSRPKRSAESTPAAHDDLRAGRRAASVRAAHGHDRINAFAVVSTSSSRPRERARRQRHGRRQPSSTCRLLHARARPRGGARGPRGGRRQELTLAADDAYGERDEDLVFSIERGDVKTTSSRSATRS